MVNPVLKGEGSLRRVLVGEAIGPRPATWARGAVRQYPPSVCQVPAQPLARDGRRYAVRLRGLRHARTASGDVMNHFDSTRVGHSCGCSFQLSSLRVLEAGAFQSLKLSPDGQMQRKRATEALLTT